MLKTRIFIAIFGLPFFCVGLYMIWSIGTSIVEWEQMKNWQSVQAHVIRGGYESHSDDGTTYKAYGEYSYSFNGNAYNGTRVSTSEGADNIGSFQQDLGDRLSAAQGREIEIFVDPDRPEYSIVSRDMRWGMVGFKMIFVVTFGGFGGLMVFGGIFGKNKPQPDPTLPQYQEAPWLANSAWQGAEIGSGSKHVMYFAWFFAIMWNAISMPIPFLIKDEILVKHNYPALLGLLFPVIGVGIIIWALRRTLEWQRFGTAPVTLDPFPGSIGGNVGGTLELNVPDASAQFLVTLSCVESSYRGNDDSRQETALWQKTAVAYTEMGLYGTRLVFRFDVPEGLRPSDAVQRGNGYIIWRLSVRADVPGTNVNRDYEIPVYPTKKTSSSISARVAETSQKATEEMDTAAARSRMQLRSGPGGEEMYYPFGRNLGAAVSGMIIGACFMGPGLFLIWHVGAPIFGGIFAAVGGLIFLCCFYMPINSLTISRDGSGGVTTVRRIFGIPVKRGYALIDDISELSAESNFSTGSGSMQVRHFTIYAKLPGAKKIVLGEDFLGQGEAEAGMAAIRQNIGLRDTVKGAVAAVRTPISMRNDKGLRR